MLKNLRRTFTAALFGATACTAFLPSPVLAQDFGLASNPDSEQVIVSAPRPGRASGPLGGQIVDVALSRAVRYDDLDLKTVDGMDRLRWRVSSTAHILCDRLDTLFPVATDDSPNCFKQAVSDAVSTARRDRGMYP